MRETKGIHLKAMCMLLVLASACASAPDGVRQGIVVGLHALTAASAVVAEVDKAKIAAAMDKADKGDVPGAQKDLDTWEAQYQKIAKAFQVLWDLMRTAADGVTNYEKGLANKTDLATWSAGLVKAVADMAVALSDAGVHVDGIN